MNKRVYIWLLLVVLAGTFCMISCDDDDTYAEKKERERNAINAFLKKGTCVYELDSKDTLLYVPPIKVISEEQFYAQDSTTNVAENEYVLMNSTGIYMQIVDKGNGEKLTHGETAKILNRYIEFNILGDSVMSRNNNLYYIAVPDLMTVSNSYGVFTASYVSGVMRSIHGTTSVPEGWLIPLTYIRLGRPTSADGGLAKVRLIVPHTSGTPDAQTESAVYPCFYELTYQRGR